MSNEIELVNPIPELVDKYRNVVIRAIQLHLITLEQWNTRYKFYRDDCGYSIIHYLEGYMSGKIGTFITANPIMIDNRDDLQKRFGIKIITLEEFGEDPKPMIVADGSSQSIENEKLKKYKEEKSGDGDGKGGSNRNCN